MIVAVVAGHTAEVEAQSENVIEIASEKETPWKGIVMSIADNERSSYLESEGLCVVSRCMARSNCLALGSVWKTNKT